LLRQNDPVGGRIDPKVHVHVAGRCIGERKKGRRHGRRRRRRNRGRRRSRFGDLVLLTFRGPAELRRGCIMNGGVRRDPRHGGEFCLKSRRGTGSRRLGKKEDVFLVAEEIVLKDVGKILSALQTIKEERAGDVGGYHSQGRGHHHDGSCQSLCVFRGECSAEL
jgi:hypothetical protein